jgi:hypothetical protein
MPFNTISRLLGWKGLRPRRELSYFCLVECPVCGTRGREQMHGRASLHFYQCPRCQQVITPRPGSCCVCCSHGDTPCIWQQREDLGLPHPAV